jgi:hypothetical protein
MRPARTAKNKLYDIRPSIFMLLLPWHIGRLVAGSNGRTLPTSPVTDGAKTTVFDTSLLVFRDGMSKRRQPEPTERVPQLPELGEKGLCLLQILGVEAFGEPAIDRGQQIICLAGPTLALPQPRCASTHHAAARAGRRPLLPASFRSPNETACCRHRRDQRRPIPSYAR